MSKVYTLSNEENKLVSATSDTFIAMIDGASISTIDEFYTSISKALNFPDYFGDNLDALDEMLYDLDWIEHDCILLLIKNSTSFLKDYPEQKQEIISLIDEIDNPYFEVCFIE